MEIFHLFLCHVKDKDIQSGPTDDYVSQQF